MENKLRYIVKKHCLKNKINDFSVIEQKQNEIISKYNSNQINFKDKISYTLYTTNKKRKLAIVEDGSVEYFVITLLNKIVQNKIKPHFKSRNRVILELFDNLKLLYKFKDFTIVRFDFKNYFDSISSQYVFNKSLIHYNFTKNELDLLKLYVDSMPYCKAGIALSNILAEEMGRLFDEKIKLLMPATIFYNRYVDDGIIILNEIIDEDEIKSLLQKAINDVFYDKSIETNYKNKTKIDFNRKYQYITYNSIPTQFDFLGYKIVFEKNNTDIEIKLGMSDKKRKKYYNKAKHIIAKCYTDEKKLRLILKCLSRRCVYTTVSKNNDINKWISKGISYNYGDLLYFNKVDPTTKDFLSKLYINIFNDLKIPLPNYLKSSSSAIGYDLYENIQKNKAIIFDEKIGVSESVLKNWINIVNPIYNFKNKKYYELVKEFLIRCHIGY